MYVLHVKSLIDLNSNRLIVLNILSNFPPQIMFDVIMSKLPTLGHVRNPCPAPGKFALKTTAFERTPQVHGTDSNSLGKSATT